MINIPCQITDHHHDDHVDYHDDHVDYHDDHFNKQIQRLIIISQISEQ